MNPIIKKAVKNKSIFEIRSSYKKVGYPKNKLFSSVSNIPFQDKISLIKMSSRRLTGSEAEEILIQANRLIKITPFERKAGVLDILRIIIDLVSPYTWLFIKDARLNTAFKMLKEYVSDSVNVSASIKKKAISTIWPPTDMSMATLEMLENEGYTTVVWQSSDSSIDNECMLLDNEEWLIADFINATSYNAPIFSKSHVGCKCRLIVSGPGLRDEIVMAY